MVSTHALPKETHFVVIVSVPRRKCARNLVQTLQKSVIRVDTSGPTEPLPVSRIVQAQLLGNFGCRHCIKQFLFNARKTSTPASCVLFSISCGRRRGPDRLFSSSPGVACARSRPSLPRPIRRNAKSCTGCVDSNHHILISVSPTTYSSTEDPLQTTDSSCKTSASIVQVCLG